MTPFLHLVGLYRMKINFLQSVFTLLAATALSTQFHLFYVHFIVGKTTTTIDSTLNSTATAKRVNFNNNHPYEPGGASSHSQRKWAYAFLLSKCDPNEPNESYRGKLYNILVSTKVLQLSDSKADIVAMIQMIKPPAQTSSSSSSLSTNHINNSTTTTTTKATPTEPIHSLVLPKEDQQLLESMNIKVVYIPPPPHSSSHNGEDHQHADEDEEETEKENELALKFWILNLIEYSRVIYLENIMPLCSLDYLFDLSDDPKLVLMDSSSSKQRRERSATTIGATTTWLESLVPQQPLSSKQQQTATTATENQQRQQHQQQQQFRLKENVILAWKLMPAWDAIFMLQPKLGDYDQILEIIQTRRRSARNQRGYASYFDSWLGWGQPMLPRGMVAHAPYDSKVNHIERDVNDDPETNSLLVGRLPPSEPRSYEKLTNGYFWSWKGVESTSGLLYYWTKYVKQSVSIVIKDEIENWTHNNNNNDNDNDNNNEENKLERILSNGTNQGDHPLWKYSCLPKWADEQRHSYGYKSRKTIGQVPYRDFRHFVTNRNSLEEEDNDSNDNGKLMDTRGKKRQHQEIVRRRRKRRRQSSIKFGGIPWEALYAPPRVESIDDVQSSWEYWFYILRIIQNELNMTIDEDYFWDL